MKISFAKYNVYKNNYNFTGLNPSKADGKYTDKFIKENLFFVNMTAYGKNKKWAKEMYKLYEDTTELIKSNNPFNSIVTKIEREIGKINGVEIYGRKRAYPGVFNLGMKGCRGIEYKDRYNKLFKKKCKYEILAEPNAKYLEANTCMIKKLSKNSIHISYGTYKNCHAWQISNLDLAKKEYEHLRRFKNPSLEQINKSCATIHWLIAQESPWQKGSDSIARILTSSIYNAYDIQLTPLKDGVSLDFEAFYSNLDDYVKKYPKLFLVEPYKRS